MKFVNKNRKGFTVLELVVVTGIMVILMVGVMTNFRGYEHKSLLDTETDKIFSVLRQAQIFSLTGQLFNGSRYNFGVHFETCSSGSCEYVLFADLDDDKRYDAGEEYEQSEFNILEGVFVQNMNVGGAVSELDVLFEAPLGEIYFNNSQATEEAQIIFAHTKFEGTKIITINSVSGQIDVE
jgi:type II secretory pathway pseudopilin PulG